MENLHTDVRVLVVNQRTSYDKSWRLCLKSYSVTLKKKIVLIPSVDFKKHIFD